MRIERVRTAMLRNGGVDDDKALEAKLKAGELEFNWRRIDLVRSREEDMNRGEGKRGDSEALGCLSYLNICRSGGAQAMPREALPKLSTRKSSYSDSLAAVLFVPLADSGLANL